MALSGSGISTTIIMGEKVKKGAKLLGCARVGGVVRLADVMPMGFAHRPTEHHPALTVSCWISFLG